MANDIQDRIGQILGSDSARELAGTAFNEALKAFGNRGSSNGDQSDDGGSEGSGGHSGVKGLAAGAGAAALAPLAAKGIGKLIKGNGIGSIADAPKKLTEGATSKLGDTVEGKLKDKVEDAGGPSGILKDGLKSALPFGGGGGGKSGKQDAEGVGKGRRMPVQQQWDIGLPIETVYNQWTQFEEWPKFMHRVTRVSQEDPCKVNFSVKIWGKTKEFTADIETQRPDDRIKWKTSQGMNVTGVVAFRELGPSLTRVMLSFDVAPGSLIEKYARGARYVKRAARADFHRLVAFIEMLENETGAWRGVIEDGELVEDHDPSYDETREYGDADELVHGRGTDEDEDEDSDEDSDDEESEDEDEDENEESTGRNGGEPRQQRRSSRSRSSGQSSGSRAQSRSSGSSRSAGGSRSSRGSSGSRSSGSRSSGSRSSGSRSSGSSKSSGGSGRSSSGRSSGSSGSSRSSSRSSGSGSSRRASSTKSSGSKSSGTKSSGTKSSGSKSSGSRTSGRSRSRSASGGSRSSSEHQGRQRSRSRRS